MSAVAKIPTNATLVFLTSATARIRDDIDRAILALLQNNADTPDKRIAEAVGLSTSAVERRIIRLKQDGVIEKIVAVISPKAADRTLTVLVELEIQNEQRHTLDQFHRWVDRAPEVQSCWYVTGDMDYVLLVAVRNLDAYNAFIERLMSEQQPLVRKYKSLIALTTVNPGALVCRCVSKDAGEACGAGR